MILTDGLHLVSDRSIEELHRFAGNLGLKRSWFQPGGARKIPHYDLTTRNAVRRAQVNGAVRVAAREIVRRAIRNHAIKRLSYSSTMAFKGPSLSSTLPSSS